jgi:hypothetical protein
MTTSSFPVATPTAKIETPVAAAVAILTTANTQANTVQDAARKAASIIVTDSKQFASLTDVNARAKAIVTLYAKSLTNVWFQKVFNACVVTLIQGGKVEVVRHFTKVDGKKVYSTTAPKPTPDAADAVKTLKTHIAESNTTAAASGDKDAVFAEVVTLPAAEAVKVLKMEDIIKTASKARAATGTGRIVKAKADEPVKNITEAGQVTEAQFIEKLNYHINSASLVLPLMDKLVARADRDEYTMQYLITKLANAGFKCHSDKDLMNAKAAREAAAKNAVK